MGTDRGAILKQAQLLTSRGQFDKAITEWQKLITGTNADATLHNTIGDLQVKRNSPSEAIESYLKGAAAYKACGDPLKAIAVYRKILKLDPNRLTVYQQLGDLNAERGLISSAISDYTALCKLLQRAGRTRDALQVYRKMGQTDPGNIEIKQRIVDICVQEALAAEAVDAYLVLGKEYQTQHRRDDARRAYEAARKLEPKNAKVEKAIKSLDHLEVATTGASTPAPGKTETGTSRGSSYKGEGAGRRASLEAANQQIRSGEYAEAEAALMDMLSREPGDPEVCRLLARLHLKRGELSVAMGEFQFLAGAAMRAEDYALAESMLKEFLEAEPHCALLIESLAQVYEHKGDVSGAVAQYGQALSLLLKRPDPDQPTLPEDLLSKLKELAPGSEEVVKFAKALEGGTPQPHVQEGGSAQGVGAAAHQEVQHSEQQAGSRQRVDTQPQGSVEPLRLVQEPTKSELVEAATEAEAIAAESVGETVEATQASSAGSVHHPSPIPNVEAEAAAVMEPAAAPAEGETLQAADEQNEIVRSTTPQPPSSEVPGEAEEPPVLPAAARAASLETEPAVTVAQSVMGEDEARARYELGVAYKDMGLFDEAFEEFRQTIGVKPLFLDTCCMMADCFKEQGASQTAIMHYEQALTAARDDEDRTSEIRYELGLLYEAEGMLENAVQAWSAIGSYRDAAERLERIKATQGTETTTGDPVLSGTGQGAEPMKRTKKRRVSYL